MQFYYVYKSVQHPEINNFVSAFTIEERLKHIAEAKRLLKTEIPWICDTMDNVVKKAFGEAPNGEFILDPEGKVVRKRFWSNPQILRQDLIELVGPVDKVTTVEDLPARFVPEPRSIASGVVARIALPKGLMPLRIEPIADDQTPFFAKLRAEATESLLESGSGSMYLGVYLDPLYKVHWNNRAGRVTVKVEPSDGLTMSPQAFESPEVEEDADVDPRQFLVEMQRDESLEAIEVSVTYTVCDDAETFCRQITQKYRVPFEGSRDLGSRPGEFLFSMFANVRDLDKNKDGDITKDELPAGEVTLYIGHMDFDGNEIIERSEIDTFMKMFNNGRGIERESR